MNNLGLSANFVRSGKTLRVFYSNILPTWPHLFDGVLVDEVVVVLVQRTVQRHAVALEQQVLPTRRTLISELAEFFTSESRGFLYLKKIFNLKSGVFESKTKMPYI